MHVGSNPTARTSQSQSPRSPYRGAGRLFCTRFAGSIASHRHSMICGSLLPISFRLFNHDMRLSFPYLPRLPYCFPSPTPRIVLFDPPYRFTVRLGGTRRPRLSSPRSLSDGRGEFVSRLALVRLSFCSRYAPRFPIRPIGFSPSSSPRFPPDGSWSPRLSASLYDRRGECVFFAYLFVFIVDFDTSCDTLFDIHAGVVERQTRQI